MTDIPEWLRPTLKRVADRATANDVAGQWPAADLDDLAALGAMRWAIGKAYGGEDIDAVELHDRYEHLASASLATALVLSQRDAAAGFLESSTNEPLKADLLSKLARNERWTTIGISHLTTSHQSGSLVAECDRDGIVIDGVIPWSTGGSQSDFIVAGARCSDGRQVIFALPTNRPGVTVKPPIKLATLSAAPTSQILCEKVRIESSLLIAGPAEKALGTRARSLPIGQAFAAIGLTRAALGLMANFEHASAVATVEAMTVQLNELSSTVRSFNTRLEQEHDLQSGPLIRSECNNLAIRATHAAITLYKGSGLCLDHPAQRLAREALFLLVWSSPASVTDRNLELISEMH